MCEFVSWIEYEGGVYFLDNATIADRLDEYKKFNKEWREDLPGHGAIQWWYPELKGKGVHKECTSSSIVGYPKEVAEAIKTGRMSLVGYNIDLLNNKGIEEYRKIKQPALEEYKKIEQTAWEEYKKIKQPALEEYEKIKQTALEEYEKIKQTAFWSVFSKKCNRLKDWR